MASKTSKWMATVASAAISVMVGGAAFAAPASAFEGTGTTMGLVPDRISEAVAAGRTAVAEGQRQVRQVTNSLRSTDGASDVISKVLSKVLSNVGTKVAEVKGQARRALDQAS